MVIWWNHNWCQNMKRNFRDAISLLNWSRVIIIVGLTGVGWNRDCYEDVKYSSASLKVVFVRVLFSLSLSSRQSGFSSESTGSLEDNGPLGVIDMVLYPKSWPEESAFKDTPQLGAYNPLSFVMKLNKLVSNVIVYAYTLTERHYPLFKWTKRKMQYSK